MTSVTTKVHVRQQGRRQLLAEFDGRGAVREVVEQVLRAFLLRGAGELAGAGNECVIVPTRWIRAGMVLLGGGLAEASRLRM